MKRVLILQHTNLDHPGRFLDFFAEDGFTPVTVKLWAGEDIPNLAGYDLMFALGGPQDVWQEEQYPWLVAEKQAIREWVLDRAKPYFGVCLGHQLLADALGGQVGLAQKSEIGAHQISLTSEGINHPLCKGLKSKAKVVQWHMAEVKTAPPGATVLASSPLCQIQALAVGRHAISTQFHAECSAQSLANWGANQGYLDILERERGPGHFAEFQAGAYSAMREMNLMMRRLFENLKTENGLA